MAKHDVTTLNVAIERLLAATTNPRHRFLLQAYSRHRYLEVAGRYEELFAPDMMVADPVYHFHAGRTPATLRGQDNIKRLYRMWAETNQCIFFVETEQVAVADNFVASTVTAHQQVWGPSLTLGRLASYLPGVLSETFLERVLARTQFKADANAMYLCTTFVEMIWLYDDRGRLRGEDVWEPDPANARIVKLDPADVLTTAESRRLIDPLIRPLPSFDEMVLGTKDAA
jgi:hypothetical protein